MKRFFQTAIITETVVADVTTQTARDTLKVDLGLGAAVTHLQRRDVWILRVDAPDLAEALEMTEKLATETKLFVNPNKHRFQVRQLPLEAVPQDPKVKDGAFHFAFVSRFREDTRGAVALDNLRKLYGYGEEIESIEFGVHWELGLKTESADKATEIFNRVLIANDARSGLFVNPHSQLVFFQAAS